MSLKSNKAHTEKEAAGLATVLEKGGPVDPREVVTQVSQKGTFAGPISYSQLTEDDKKYLLAKSYLSKNKYYGDGVLTGKDLKLFLRKLSEVEAEEKDRFIVENVNWENPAIYPWLNKVAPDFIKRRMDYLNVVMNQQGQMAKIAMTGGPTTPEEMELVFALSTGKQELHAYGPHILATDPSALGGSAMGAGQATAAMERGWLYHMLRPVEHEVPDQRALWSKRMRQAFGDFAGDKRQTAAVGTGGTLAGAGGGVNVGI